MDKKVPELYRSYGKYVNAFRAFPLDLDGLKPVERRVLLSAYQIASERFVKSARVDGHCLGHFHPHGTSYGTIVQLVRQGFLDGQGSFGANIGVEPTPPAAMRYTGCRLSKSAKTLAFKLIKYVPWQLGELDEKEPLFLPTMFPLCLLGEEYTQGIGFGYKTFIPCFRIEDLYKRLLFLLGQRKTKPIIKPISDCAIISPDKEIEELLTTGKASISVKGVSIAHPKDHSVILRSWPPGRKFESLLNKFAKERENNDIGFQDLSTEETYIVFKILKQRNKDAIYNKFVKKLDKVLTGNIPFEMVVVDSNRQVRTASVDELLLGSYKMFLNSNVAMLESEISRYQEMRKEYLVLQAIRPILSEHLKEQIKDVKLVIDDICKRTGLSKKMVTGLFAKYRINKLLTLSIDIDEINKLVKELKKYLDNAFQFSLDQYVEVMNGRQKK